MPKPSATARARKIKLILFDVDGVLTDGKLYIFPAPAGIQQSTQDHAAKHGGQGGFGLGAATPATGAAATKQAVAMAARRSIWRIVVPTHPRAGRNVARMEQSAIREHWRPGRVVPYQSPIKTRLAEQIDSI